MLSQQLQHIIQYIITYVRGFGVMARRIWKSPSQSEILSTQNFLCQPTDCPIASTLNSGLEFVPTSS